MRYSLGLVALSTAALLLAVSSAQGAFISYITTLSGPNEATPNASPGTGSGQVDVDTTGHTLRVRVSFTGLLGTTTASHIHSATPTPLTGTAIVATTTPSFSGFPLGVTSGTYDSGLLDLTSATTYNPAYITANGGTPTSAEPALLASFAAQTSYLNIHTTVVPGGEIRGFLVAVPEPTALALLGSATLLTLRRRRCR